MSPSRIHLAAAAVALFELSVPCFADVIYGYREEGSATIIGTLQIKSPPASAATGWSTANSSDLIALFLDDAFFGLGSGNLLSNGGASGASASSLTGVELDSGGLAINYPPVIPSDPSDPTIEKRFSMDFAATPAGDFFGLATYITFPNGDQVVEDLFVQGDWIAERTAAIPEPGTLTLMAVGLFCIAWTGYHKRKATTERTLRISSAGAHHEIPFPRRELLHA
jgi:hypothetical protein